MIRPTKFIVLWLPVLLYAGGVFYLSSLPGVAAAAAWPDYLIHSIEYLGLTLFIVRALNEGLLKTIPLTVHFAAIGMAVLYAVTDEIHQLFVPRRTSSLKDVLSDTLGAFLAVGIAELIQRARSVRRAPLEVILYTRQDCHLCGDARAVLSEIGSMIPLEVDEVDVQKDPELVERFGDEVPVILARGVKISKLAPDPTAVRRRLTRMFSKPE